MAQDLKKVFPNAVTKGEDGFLRIRNEDMFYAVINAIKELACDITSVKSEIKDLRSQNAELKAQNAELIKRIEKLEKSKKCISRTSAILSWQGRSPAFFINVNKYTYSLVECYIFLFFIIQLFLKM